MISFKNVQISLIFPLNKNAIFKIIFTFAMIAGGLVVMKSNESPRRPIPSLSSKNKGRLAKGWETGRFNRSVMIEAHSWDGMGVEISAPVVVVPIEPLPPFCEL